MHRFASAVCSSFALVIFIGCTTPLNNAAPPLAPVSGKVNLDGKPMAEGIISFSVMGQPPKTMPIKDGAFSGNAFVGKSRVEVVLEKDGPPATTDPTIMTKINLVAPKELNAEVTATGANPSTFEVSTAR